MTTILLTGLPRSGTSLVCACLNSVPDCLALVEPMAVPRHSDALLAVNEIIYFSSGLRSRILHERMARSAIVDGAIPDNTLEDIRADGALRRVQSEVGDIPISKPLSDDFLLAIKHPAMFTALAEKLRTQLPIYAIVRHPLAALSSWQTVAIAIRDGRWPAAEKFAPDLRRLLDDAGDRLSRQVALIGWIFRAYRAFPLGQVLRYEAIAQDPGAALAPLIGAGRSVAHPVRALDPQTRYVGVDLAPLARALLAIEADVEPFYPGFAASLQPYCR